MWLFHDRKALDSRSWDSDQTLSCTRESCTPEANIIAFAQYRVAGTPWGDAQSRWLRAGLECSGSPGTGGLEQLGMVGDSDAREAAGRGGIPVFCLGARARNPQREPSSARRAEIIRQPEGRDITMGVANKATPSACL